MSKMKELLLDRYIKGECDCTYVCGWTKDHTLEKQGKWWVCTNCGTEMWNPDEKEQLISFDCETHGAQDWLR